MVSNFWGTEGQYKYLHRWIGVTAGKPQHCENADESCKGMYEWANKSGRYLKVVSDWVRLCRSHHRRHDDSVSTHAVLRPKTHCKRGHEFTQENSRVYASNPSTKRCMICQRAQWRGAYYKKKEQKSCLAS